MEASEFFDRGFPPFSYNKPHGAVMAGRFFETGFLQIGHQPSHMASLFGHSAADAMGGVSRSGAVSFSHAVWARTDMGFLNSQRRDCQRVVR